jgi:regulator of extracellular matrix RemA (YlzA/DUF370 family)
MKIGFGSVVPWPRVVAILNPKSASMKRLRDEAQGAGRLIDSRSGRKCRALVVTDSNHVFLSANSVELLQERLAAGRKEG